MSIVITPSKEILDKILSTYPNNATLPTGAILRSKLPDVIVTVYKKSGKVMFQGKNETLEANRWDSQVNNSLNLHKKNLNTNTKMNSLPSNLENMSIIGSDEVGTGAYFGPLTVTAAYVKTSNIPWLKNLGVVDSKKLTDQQIMLLVPQIIAKIPYHVVNILPKKYNELNQQYNANGIKALAHNFAIIRLLNKINPVIPELILIDQFTQPQSYWRYLENQPAVIRRNVHFTVRGEQAHVAVATASLIARYIELKTLQELSSEVNVTLPIGAGSYVDQVAAELINKNINLKNYAKLHFANTQKAEKLATKRR